MATRGEEELLRELAKTISEALNFIFEREMVFFLNVTPANTADGEHNISSYISNARRKDAIKWMKDTIERFEKNETIAAAQGEA